MIETSEASSAEADRYSAGPPWWAGARRFQTVAATPDPSAAEFSQDPRRKLSHYLGRLRRGALLFRHSVHLKLWVANALSRLLPDFFSGVVRGQLYRWAGFRLGRGVLIIGNLKLKSSRPDFYDKLVVGSGTVIAGGVSIYLDSQVTLGKNVAIAPNVLISSAGHSIGPGSMRMGPNVALPVVVEDGAWVRLGAIIAPGVTIGRGSIVAAGAVVLKDAPANSYVEGSPAKVIRQLPWGDR